MKSDNDSITCSLFRKLIMDFIDDELSEKVRPAFLTHSLSCPACCKELKEMQSVKKALASLAPVSVSSEFDFRLKASLRMEESRLRSPMYRLQLLLKDNMVSLVGVPVAAALLLAGVLMYDGVFPGARTGMRTASQNPAVRELIQTSPANHSTAENVHYVLESVELSEVGTAAKPNEKTVSNTSGVNSINLIKY